MKSELEIHESCIACHACCHHLVLRLRMPEDLQRSLSVAMAAEEYEPNKYRLMPRKKPDGWNFYCPFLAGSGLCINYEGRPDACRTFKRSSPACHAQRRLYRHVNPS